MPFEKRHNDIASALGVPLNETVPFHITNQSFADALHELVLAPLAEQGVDFWWTDWQQTGEELNHGACECVICVCRLCVMCACHM